jgi:hypothetical protein
VADVKTRRGPLAARPGNNRGWWLAGVLGLVHSFAWADAGPPMITDDPATPGDGHWEINIATTSDHQSRATEYELPLLDINYGLGDRIQLKFEVPYVILDGPGSTRKGAGDSLVGVKWRFFDGGDDGWQISTYPQIETAFRLGDESHDGIAESGVRYLLPIEVQRSLGPVGINFETGRWFRPGQQGDSWIAGVVVSGAVSEGFDLLAELHDEADLGFHHDELILNFGARYDWSDRYSLLMSAGTDLHNGLDAKSNLLTYLALQIRL